MAGLIENGKAGVEIRDGFMSYIGGICEKGSVEAFALGYNIVNLMPQLEFYDRSNSYPEGKKFSSDLFNGIKTQLELVKASANKIDLHIVASTVSSLDLNDPLGIREKLMQLGSEIDQSLMARNS